MKSTCPDWKNTDWVNWSAEVEANMWLIQLYPDVMNNGQRLWDSFLTIIQQATKNHVPNKIVSIHSKPFWNCELTILSVAVRYARRRFQARATPHNRDLLQSATVCFKEKLINAKNNWVKKRTEGMNIKDSAQFWKRYKKVFGAAKDNYICNLKEGDILVTSDND